MHSSRVGQRESFYMLLELLLCVIFILPPDLINTGRYKLWSLFPLTIQTLTLNCSSGKGYIEVQRQNWLGPPFQKRRVQTLFWKNLRGHYEDITFFQNNVYILCKPKLNTKVIWDFRANSKTYLETYISKTRKQVVVLFFQLYTPIQKEISRLFGWKQQYPLAGHASTVWAGLTGPAYPSSMWCVLRELS